MNDLSTPTAPGTDLATTSQGSLTTTGNSGSNTYAPADGFHELSKEIVRVIPSRVELAKCLGVKASSLPDFNFNEFILFLDIGGVYRICGQLVKKDEKEARSSSFSLVQHIRSSEGSPQARIEWLAPNTYRDLSNNKDRFDDKGGESESDISRFYMSLLKKSRGLGASDIHIVMFKDFGYIFFRVNNEIIFDDQPRPASTISTLCNHIYNHRVQGTRADWSAASILDCVDNVALDGVATRWRFTSCPNEDRKHANIVIREVNTTDISSFTDVDDWDGYSVADLTKEYEKLGYADQHIGQFIKAFLSPSGGIFIGGKTRSGKTRFLNVSLTGATAIFNFQKVVTCIEDVPELSVPLSRRTPVDPDSESGITFSDAIKSALRRDSDVIAIGEIRTGDSGPAVKRAIVTDHLVPASLHVNNLMSMFERLDDLGIERQFLSGHGRALAFIWQKLLPRLCTNCRVPLDPDDEIVDRLVNYDISLNGVFTKNPNGCSKCEGRAPGLIIAASVLSDLTSEMRAAIRTGDDDALFDLWGKDATNKGYPIGVRAVDHALSHVEAGIVCPKSVESVLGRLDSEFLP